MAGQLRGFEWGTLQCSCGLAHCESVCCVGWHEKLQVGANSCLVVDGILMGPVAQSVEAAREVGMAAVVVAGTQPLYELGAADLVVRQLDELSLVNLKQLFRNEAHVEGGAVRTAPRPWLTGAYV